MTKYIAAFVVGLLVLPLCALAWFELGSPPVAVADPPFPFEKKIVRVPLHARIDREMPDKAPIAADAAAFEAGAKIYRQQCSACHGLMGHASPFAAHMFPRAPQLWEKHGDGVGVSDDPPGEIYWKAKNGIRLTGMPAYEQVLSDTEIWQVSLLLGNADKVLPEAAVALLEKPLE